MILALDLATVSGIAIWDYAGPVYVMKMEASPIELVSKVESLLEPFSVIVYEKHVHFRGAGVTRKLNELNGYVNFRLAENGYRVFSHFPGKERKALYAPYAGFTKDEADAVILINSFLKSPYPLGAERITYDVYKNRFERRGYS